jgi:FkbM family methyltransferase
MIRIIKNIIYSVVDLLTLGRGFKRNISGFELLFPAKWTRYFENNYEEENIKFLKKYCIPGSYVIDIGAHLGLLSVICGKMAGKNGKVWSFEPTPVTFNELNKILKLNKVDDRVIPIKKAVSDKKGTINFYISDVAGSNSNSLLTSHPVKRNPVPAEMISLDEFISENKITKLDIIKIDAEGSELDVLNGSRNTFRKFHPSIILALHPSLIIKNNQDLGQIFDFIKSMGYKILYKDKLLDKESFTGMTDFFDVHLLPIK